jgi:hypothetical protein
MRPGLTSPAAATEGADGRGGSPAAARTPGADGGGGAAASNAAPTTERRVARATAAVVVMAAVFPFRGAFVTAPVRRGGRTP